MTNAAFPTRYWHALQDGRVECDLCPRHCRLHEGQQGMCFVRANQDGKVVLTTYGRASGYCVDPVEKKPLNHFLPGSSVLSFGTAGCNMACKFCQNWDISKSRDMDTLADAATPERIAAVARELKCGSVAFTYNDPVIFHEYAVDVAKACHALGIKTVAVTAGYVCEEPRAEFYQHMDAANVDLKGFTEHFYQSMASAHLQPVLDTLVHIKKHTRTWLEVTTLLIPGHNDSAEELEEMTRWMVENLGPDVPLHFTAFHPDYRLLDVPPTPLATLTGARQIARKNGLHHVYLGNVHADAEQATCCAGCGQVLVGRSGYTITAWALDHTGRCPRCGVLCAGVFEDHPGHWGARRQPVRLGVLDP